MRGDRSRARLAVLFAAGALACHPATPSASPGLFAICPAASVVTPTGAVLVSAVNGQTFATLPPMAVGDSLALTVTLTNTGGAPATALTATTAASPILSLTSDTCGDTVGVGASCTILVEITATSAGIQSGTLDVSYFDGQSAETLSQGFTVEGTTSPFSPAAHGAPTQPLVPYHGGAVLTHPRLITVSFADTDDDDQIAAHGDWIVGSDWLLAVGSDYGVALGTHLHVRLTDKSPATLVISALGDYAADQIGSGALPAPDDQTVYMFFLSPNTTRADGVYTGEHAWTKGGIVYAAIVAPCASGAPPDFYSASHELIEAATDPLGTGYHFEGFQDEVADVCEGPGVSDDGYTLPLVWSDTRATAGESPCAPADAGVAFNVDDGLDGGATVQGGGSVTLTLTGWSTAPVGDWQVEPYLESGPVAFLSAEGDLMNNGRTEQLTINIPKGTAPGVESVWLYSRDLAGHIGGVEVVSLTVQ